RRLWARRLGALGAVPRGLARPSPAVRLLRRRPRDRRRGDRLPARARRGPVAAPRRVRDRGPVGSGHRPRALPRSGLLPRASPAPGAVAIRSPPPSSRVSKVAGLGGRALHPTPLYSILWNVFVGVVLARMWALGAALHLVGGVYLVLGGLGRFVEESYRGEPQ